MTVKVTAELSNFDKAQRAWGDDLPSWVAELAAACDRSNQREVGVSLGRSSGYVSRIISRSYTGSYAEAEQLVRSHIVADQVTCPIWNAPIPLSACIRNRRFKGVPRTQSHHAYARACGTCPKNTDRKGE